MLGMQSTSPLNFAITQAQYLIRSTYNKEIRHICADDDKSVQAHLDQNTHIEKTA